MDRRSFLRRLGIAAGAAAVAPRVLPDLVAEPVYHALPAVTPEMLVASGGLCAPLTPYYSLALYERGVVGRRGLLASLEPDAGVS